MLFRSYFEKAGHRINFSYVGEINAVEDELKRLRYTVEEIEGDTDKPGTNYLFAQRFSWAQYGTFLSHLALLMLLLGGLLGVILAGVAIALAAQRYAIRHYDHVAILKTLGATPAGVDTIFIVMFVVLGMMATLLGSGIGYGVQLGIVEVLQPLIPIELPAPSMKPVWLGMSTGFICLLSFALPPLLKLRKIEPVRVIRRDLGDNAASDWVTYSFAVLGTIGLMWWYSEDLMLTALIFSGGACAIVVLSAVSYLLLRSGRVLGMQAGSAWRLALAGMQRRGKENTMQILIFGLAIMLLLILYLVRTALIAEWQAADGAARPDLWFSHHRII